VILLVRRRRQSGQPVSVRAVTGIAAIWLLILAAGLAAMQLGSVEGRALTTLHAAIRYAITGDRLYAGMAEGLLRNLPGRTAAPSMVELGRACQAYALAYDLIRPGLGGKRKTEIESDLFAYSRPLFGALQGWRSCTSEGSPMASGLGMTGLVVGSEAFVDAACQTVDKTLRFQLEAGLHREGTGPGVRAFDGLLNLFDALRRAGRQDFYANPAFQDFTRSTLALVSPAGTLPLFGAASLDDAAVPAFLLKSAHHVPDELGRRCVDHWDAWWRIGRYFPEGTSKLLAHWVAPHWFFLENPFVLFQFRTPLQRESPAASSAILGSGRIAVLGSGRGADSLYLAVNAQRSFWNQQAKQVLTFDLYARNALLLHGAGYPGAGRSGEAESLRTDASNSITFAGANQSPSGNSGVSGALLNQPVFDYVRVLADKTYEHGQIQRDVIMVRPAVGAPGYFVLVDEIHSIEPLTRVEGFLHGRGRLSLSFNQVGRWTIPALTPPAIRSREVFLSVYPLGGRAWRSQAGKLYAAHSWLTQDVETLVLESTGSGRFATVLYPRPGGVPEPKVEVMPESVAGRIGDRDWVSLGDPAARHQTGPLRHVSECVLVRDRSREFPAVLMVFGTDIEFGPHRLVSSKPVTVSLGGLSGGFLSTRPDTRIELHSPAIRSTDRFVLDGQHELQPRSGRLEINLSTPGEHTLGHHMTLTK
jgi:hypothetical protein